MDRTAWTVVSLCLIGMGLWYIFLMPEPPAPAPVAPVPVEQGETVQTPVAPADPATGTTMAEAAEPRDDIPEETFFLENDYVRYEFTNQRGGLKSAILLDHTETLAESELLKINKHGDIPIGALSLTGGALEDGGYEVVEQTEESIVFEAISIDGMKVRKTWTLHQRPEEAGDALEAASHLLDFRLTISNPTGKGYPLAGQYFYGGAMGPLHPTEWPQQTGFFWNSGRKMHFKSVTAFRGNNFLGMQFSAPRDIITRDVEEMHWGGIANQFYTTIYRATTPITTELTASHFPILLKGAEQESVNKRLEAIDLKVGIPDSRLDPGQSQSWDWEIYLGPKEYAKLASLPDNQKAVMAYDRLPILGPVVKPVSQILIRMLNWLHGMVGNWGVAIILMTVVIRIVIWPLHSKANKTMKRMSLLSPKMTELREKYSDDPQKQNAELMQLYKRYGVNPFGGCLPMLLQMPIFLGFYRMLLSATEVRHESFAWIDDLSMPDTLFYMGSIPFNLLPILMAGTSVMQMAVTPKTGDKMQQRMFMLMPLIFLFICYNFASALALYWTCQNIISTGQTWLFNKRQPPELQEIKGAAGKKSWVEKLQDQAEAAKQAQEAAKSGKKPSTSAPTAPGQAGKNYYERGSRSTKPKRKKK